MDAATAQMQIALTAFDNFLASDLAALNLILANLEAKIDSIKQQIDQTRQQIEKLQAAREKAQKMASSKDEAVKTIEDANAEAADARNVALCFTRIAQDRTQAAALIAAIRNNLGNPSGFVPALQTICTFPQVSAQEVREATGLVTVFRTGRLTHCISTKVQCSAKAYSVSP
jgi:chromosome segregation ATPase